MRKWSAIFFSILLVLSLSACGQADKDNETGNRNSQVSAEKNKNNTGSTSSNTRVLIAYFTVPEDVKTSDNDAIAGTSIVVKDSEKMGNTEYVAGLVQKTIGGDLFRIETKDAYPLEHDTLVDQAAEEQEKELRPELSNHVENFEQYDTVILGFPNWWGDLPMPVYSFLEEYDFAGKTIIPFVTHGGSGFSATTDTISQLQPDAQVSDNTLSLSREDVADAEDEVKKWAQGLGLQ
ncbi:MAG: flavodoxin [Clostridium sp.]